MQKVIIFHFKPKVSSCNCFLIVFYTSPSIDLFFSFFDFNYLISLINSLITTHAYFPKRIDKKKNQFSKIFHWKLNVFFVFCMVTLLALLVPFPTTCLTNQQRNRLPHQAFLVRMMAWDFLYGQRPSSTMGLCSVG